jgi:hypothetical protein
VTRDMLQRALDIVETLYGEGRSLQAEELLERVLAILENEIAKRAAGGSA